MADRGLMGSYIIRTMSPLDINTGQIAPKKIVTTKCLIINLDFLYDCGWYSPKFQNLLCNLSQYYRKLVLN
jgi:hypothetical protein